MRGSKEVQSVAENVVEEIQKCDKEVCAEPLRVDMAV